MAGRAAAAAIAELEAHAAKAGAGRVVAAEAKVMKLEARLADARSALELARDVIEEQSAQLAHAKLHHDEIAAEAHCSLVSLERELWQAAAAVAQAEERAEAAEENKQGATDALDAARANAGSLMTAEMRVMAAVGTCPVLAMPHEALRSVLTMLEPAAANAFASTSRAAFVRLASLLAVEALPAPHLVPERVKKGAARSATAARFGFGSEAGAAKTAGGGVAGEQVTEQRSPDAGDAAGEPGAAGAAAPGPDGRAGAMLRSLTPREASAHGHRRAAQWGLRVLFPAPVPTLPGHGGVPAGPSASSVGSGGGASEAGRAAPQSAIERGLGAIAASAVTSGLLTGISDSASVAFGGGMSVGSASEMASPVPSEGRRTMAERSRSMRESPAPGVGIRGIFGGGARSRAPAGARDSPGGAGTPPPSGGGISAAQAQSLVLRMTRVREANKKMAGIARAAQAETEETKRALAVAEEVKTVLHTTVTDMEREVAAAKASLANALEQHAKDQSVIAHLDRTATRMRRQAEAAGEALLEANERADTASSEASTAGTSAAAASTEQAALRARLAEASRRTDEAVAERRAAEARAAAAEKRAATAEEESLRYRRWADEAKAGGAGAGRPGPADDTSSRPGNPFGGGGGQGAAKPAASAAPGNPFGATAGPRPSAAPGNPFSATAPPAAGAGVDAAELTRLRGALADATARADAAEALVEEQQRKLRVLARHVQSTKAGTR